MSSLKELQICTRNLKRMYSVQRIPLLTANSIRVQLSSIPQLRAVATSNLTAAVSSAAAMQQQYQSFYKAATDLQAQISTLKIPTSQITANLSFGLSEFRQALQNSISVINSSKLPPSNQLVDEMHRSLAALSKAISVISEDLSICESDQTASEDLKVRAINNSEVLLGYVESTDTSGVSTSMLDTLSKMREHPVSIRSLCRVIYDVIMLLLTVLALLQGVLPDQTMEDIKCLLEQQVEIMSEAAENLPPEEAEYFDCEILQC